MSAASDDLGHPVPLNRPAGRVVSLVPSLTESVAVTRGDALVGATDWCTHPADLDVPRVRGTKNPNLAAIKGLRPDVVLANQEEHRRVDVERLRAAGVPVWVTVIQTVDQAVAALRRMFGALGWPVPERLGAAEREWSLPAPGPRVRAAIPIWRDPWMVVGSATFTGDVAARLGLEMSTATTLAGIRTSTWTIWPPANRSSSCCPMSPMRSAPATDRRCSPASGSRWSRAVA